MNLAHRLLPELRDWGAALVTVGLGVQGVECGPSPSGLARSDPPFPARSLLQLHGRSREQRYTRLADWAYIQQCVSAASPMPLFGACPSPGPRGALPTRPWLLSPDPASVPLGNGDILSYEDANRAMQTGVAGVMIAR